MKKIIAKEFLWFLAALIFAIPLTFAFLSCIDIVAEGKSFQKTDKIFIFDLFLLGFFVNFVGIYLVRLIFYAFKTVAAK